MDGVATMREWPCECAACGFSGKILGWDYELPLACPSCGAATKVFDNRKERAPGVVGDDFPGGFYAEHGVCHPDGTPRRFDSRTELKKALNKAGLVINGDTPRPYRV
jgi:hypothetical protein